MKNYQDKKNYFIVILLIVEIISLISCVVNIILNATGIFSDAITSDLAIISFFINLVICLIVCIIFLHKGESDNV